MSALTEQVRREHFAASVETSSTLCHCGATFGHPAYQAAHIAEVTEQAIHSQRPTREQIRDELAHWPIGHGYESTSVSIDDAGDMADAVLALLEGDPDA